jgi:hypothetical protein
VWVEPRSYWIHAPSPFPDHRVVRFASTVFAGRLPSFVLAVTAEPPGVISVWLGTGVGVRVGVGLGVGVAVGTGVGVMVGAVAPPKTLISVTLLNVEVVALCPR